MKKSTMKQGDEVVVISGAHKGKRGKVLNILRSKDRVVIEGVAMQKKHQRKTQEKPEGSIIEREGSIHYSNAMLASRFDAKKQKKA